MRRKVVHKPKAAGGDDKKLSAALKKLNVQPITGVEEVNMFREDGNVLHFAAPKCACTFYICAYISHLRNDADTYNTVHAAVNANTYAIYGAGQVKDLTELMPSILNQLGPDSLASLRKLAESYQQVQGQQGGAEEEDDDDDVPDLVENFDEVEGAKDEGATESKLEELN